MNTEKFTCNLAEVAEPGSIKFELAKGMAIYLSQRDCEGWVLTPRMIERILKRNLDESFFMPLKGLPLDPLCLPREAFVECLSLLAFSGLVRKRYYVITHSDELTFPEESNAFIEQQLAVFPDGSSIEHPEFNRMLNKDDSICVEYKVTGLENNNE